MVGEGDWLEERPKACLRAQIGFLKKSDRFEHEEPYAFRYKSDLAIPLSNMETEFRDVEIRDLRGQEDKADLDTCGFKIRKLRSSMRYEHFSDQSKIHGVYLKELEQLLKKDFGAVEVDFARVRVSTLPPHTLIQRKSHQRGEGTKETSAVPSIDRRNFQASSAVHGRSHRYSESC